eukprot:Clim_evm2s82 gene=Clim_evmTU2s82
MIAKTILFTALMGSVAGDIYLHNPRGSNNRCDEKSNNRNNAQRLFDSENNAAGGYAIPGIDQNTLTQDKMYYYSGSYLPITWTSQHGCGTTNECNYVIQFGCDQTLGSGVRDGLPQTSADDQENPTCTGTIPNEADSDIENPTQFGRHESFEYYQKCETRGRNQNLFRADQQLGDSATRTRQNPGGTRHGFECPEERDYYPYWHPSPWLDVAVLTTNTDRCGYYSQETEWIKSRGECSDPEFEDPIECTSEGAQWVNEPTWSSKLNGVVNGNFTCAEAPSSIINHLGMDSNHNRHQTFYWRIPEVTEPLTNCVVRLRYNITTNEVPFDLDATANDGNSPITDDPINEHLGLPLRVNIDVNQFFRGFEDRTYTFDIMPRPDELTNAVIHNLNVQGKRGNIAQVRNCVEYDFVPKDLSVLQGDYVHFQWTGSDYNDPNNAGNGRDGTDRSNLVQLNDMKDTLLPSASSMFSSADTAKLLASMGQPMNDTETCYSLAELTDEDDPKKDDDQDPKNCAVLNGATTAYFDGGPVKMDNAGTFYFVSTRNNDFTNRGQKGTMTVNSSPTSSTVIYAVAGTAGAAALAGIGFAGYSFMKKRGWNKHKDVV